MVTAAKDLFICFIHNHAASATSNQMILFSKKIDWNKRDEHAGWWRLTVIKTHFSAVVISSKFWHCIKYLFIPNYGLKCSTNIKLWKLWHMSMCEKNKCGAGSPELPEFLIPSKAYTDKWCRLPLCRACYTVSSMGLLSLSWGYNIT